MGVRHAVFEPSVAQPKAMHQGLACVEAGVFQPSHFAGHPRPVVVSDRGLDATQRA
jgi:hypothetical protein